MKVLLGVVNFEPIIRIWETFWFIFSENRDCLPEDISFLASACHWYFLICLKRQIDPPKVEHLARKNGFVKTPQWPFVCVHEYWFPDSGMPWTPNCRHQVKFWALGYPWNGYEVQIGYVKGRRHKYWAHSRSDHITMNVGYVLKKPLNMNAMLFCKLVKKSPSSKKK